MQIQNLARLLISCTVIYFIFGCKQVVNSNIFVGTLIKRKLNQLVSIPVSIQLTIESPSSGQFEIHDIHNRILETGSAELDQNSDLLTVAIPGIASQPFSLSRFSTFKLKESNQICYQGGDDLAVYFCYRANQFILKIIDRKTNHLVYSILSRYIPEQSLFSSPQQPDAPKFYQLSEMLALVRQRNFDTLLDYQSLISARESAWLADLNLLPTLGYESALTSALIGEPIYPTLIHSFTANFTPFIIPSRWLNESSANTSNEIEQASFEILKSDLVLQLSGLTYALTRVKMDLSFYVNLSKKLKAAINHIQNISQWGDSDLELIYITLSFINNNINDEILRLKQALLVYKTAIQYSLGLRNHHAGNEFEPDHENSEIIGSAIYDKRIIIQTALQNSLEIRQIDQLIEALKAGKDSTYYFNWNNITLPTALVAAKQSIIPNDATLFLHQIYDKRHELQKTITQELFHAITKYNRYLFTYHSLLNKCNNISNILNSNFDDITSARSHNDVHITHDLLRKNIETYIRDSILIHSAISQFNIARAIIKKHTGEEPNSLINLARVSKRGNIFSKLKLEPLFLGYPQRSNSSKQRSISYETSREENQSQRESLPFCEENSHHKELSNQAAAFYKANANKIINIRTNIKTSLKEKAYANVSGNCFKSKNKLYLLRLTKLIPLRRAPITTQLTTQREPERLNWRRNSRLPLNKPELNFKQ